MSRVYFDHAATAPLTLAALDAMRPHLLDGHGNPSSVHLEGQRARAAIEEARTLVAEALGAHDDEVVFTASGTEAANLALRGTTWTAAPGSRPHLVTTAIEHDAVRRTARWLDARGDADVSVVGVGEDGIVRPEGVEAVLRPDTALVSVMHVNNEVGTRQPVEAIGAMCRDRGVRFHVDAVQALGRIRVRPNEIPADLLTLSAHKVGGPKGAGVLWIRRGTKLQPALTGGSQESGLRPGTESVADIAGAARAIADAVAERKETARRLRELTGRLEDGLRSLDGCRIHAEASPRAPGFTSVAFAGVAGEAALQALDLAGFSVATGSACTSGSTRPSHVLEAMGVPRDRASEAIRFSLGPGNDADEVDRLLAVLPAVLSAARAKVAR